MGMAGAVVSDINDLETVFYNPAGLINVEPYCLIAGTTDLYGLNFSKSSIFIGKFTFKFCFFFSTIRN